MIFLEELQEVSLYVARAVSRLSVLKGQCAFFGQCLSCLLLFLVSHVSVSFPSQVLDEYNISNSRCSSTKSIGMKKSSKSSKNTDSLHADSMNKNSESKSNGYHEDVRKLERDSKSKKKASRLTKVNV